MTGREVLLLPLSAGQSALSALPSLTVALTGEGPALRPVGADRAGAPEGAGTDGFLSPGEDDPDDPTALVVTTSGSTGYPKATLLSAGALRASAEATSDDLGGPGTWLLALPAHHIAGLQVLLRSIHAATTPGVMDLRDGFSAKGFADATSALNGRSTDGRTYTSLVPTQLTRLLDSGAVGIAALTTYDAVLVGGAAAGPALVERARAQGVPVVTTYGMTETCGGCVYDGRALRGVTWRLGADGRIELGGAVVARGYREDVTHPAFQLDADGCRWFRTEDAGRVEDDGRLSVLGRLDDMIVTGGLKVSPSVVEAALGDLPGVAEIVVVGAPDAEWGERVVAVVVTAADHPAPDLADLRARVTERVAAHAAPRQLFAVTEIPLVGPGKPDRAALRRLVAGS